MRELGGKIAFVTGGASGIGLGMVQAFLAAGMKVMIADIRPDHLSHAAAELGAREDVALLPLDVTDRTAIEAAAAACVERFGAVHVLCNNAGVGVIGGAKDASYDDWDWSLAVNLTSVFNGIKAFLPYMLRQGQGGHIVNTASIAALLPASILYAAAKCGVLGLSEGLRGELAADDIGVSCLLPGPVVSNIHQVSAQRPAHFGNSGLGAIEAVLAERAPNPHWMEPRQAGDLVVQAIRDNELFILTHNEHRPGVEQRFAAITAAFPPGVPDPDGAAKLGFRISNPIYGELLAKRRKRDAEG
jgi:NAD(P)-dependent dehydrogenase (short-subunit alcohol dehydrogenase family)